MFASAGSHFNRRNYAGWLAPSAGHYSDARQQGHEVLCLLFETSGAFSKVSDDYVKWIAAKHANKLPFWVTDSSWTMLDGCILLAMDLHRNQARRGVGGCARDQIRHASPDGRKDGGGKTGSGNPNLRFVLRCGALHGSVKCLPLRVLRNRQPLHNYTWTLFPPHISDRLRL